MSFSSPLILKRLNFFLFVSDSFSAGASSKLTRVLGVEHIGEGMVRERRKGNSFVLQEELFDAAKMRKDDPKLRGLADKGSFAGHL